MNYRGSYRSLVRNSKAAMLAAIEVYNKPTMAYRDETFVVLLVNAWELALKALLSKNKQSIFYPKKRKQNYKTLALDDALTRVGQFFPKADDVEATRMNLELVATYRDNTIHFYNQPGFGSLVYALAQTSIVNYKDLLKEAFDIDLGAEINWQLMPLGLSLPIDPVEYLAGKAGKDEQKNPAVKQFLGEVVRAQAELEKAGGDTGRLLTVFKVTLESVKKVKEADVVVGVAAAGNGAGPLTVVRKVDPNVSHPLRQKDVVVKVGTLHGRKFTPYVFQAIAHKHGLKEKPEHCWKDGTGLIIRYSEDVVALVRSLTEADLEAALTDYRKRPKKQ